MLWKKWIVELVTLGVVRRTGEQIELGLILRVFGPCYSPTAHADITTGVQIQMVASTGTQYLNFVSDDGVAWQFQATESFQISARGCFDHPRDGFVDPQGIVPWHCNGVDTAIIAAANLASGISATLVGDFRYINISPIKLNAGQISITEGEPERGSGLLQYDPTVGPAVTGWTPTSLSTDVAGRFGSVFPAGGDFTNANWPADPGTLPDPLIPGLNFTVASAVPEPTSLFCLIGMTSIAWLLQ